MATKTPLRTPPDAPTANESAVVARIRPTTYHATDLVVLAGAVLASLALNWLMYTQLMPFQGAQGFLVCWLVLFLGIYYIAVRETQGPVIAKDSTMAALIAIFAVGIIVPLAMILGYVVLQGFRFLHVAFFTATLANIGPLSPSNENGGAHAIIGTLEQVGIALIISVPLGVLTAVYLNEVRGRLRHPVRIFVDAMSGVPSIVAGLFIYTLLIANGRGSFSGFAAALALSILMLPTVTRTSEVVLRLVPGGLREASLALGAPEWRTVLGVVLPTARTGIVTAIILGVARVVGETAPLIVTSLGSSVMNANPFSGAQASLPLSGFRLFQSSQPADVARAWVFALVLLLLVLFLFVLARRTGRRQLNR